MLTQEDRELWKKITDSVTTSVFYPATAIRPYAVRGEYLLDLHGLTVAQAHAQFKSFITQNSLRNSKYVTIITGLSGIIQREFPFWTISMPEIRRIETLNGGGAFKVYLRRYK